METRLANVEHILDRTAAAAAPTSDLAPDAGDARPVCRSVVLAGGRGNVGAMASRGRGARRQGHDRLPLLVTAFLTALYTCTSSSERRSTSIVYRAPGYDECPPGH